MTMITMMIYNDDNDNDAANHKDDDNTNNDKKYAQIRTFAWSLCFFRVKRPEFQKPHEVVEGFLM